MRSTTIETPSLLVSSSRPVMIEMEVDDRRWSKKLNLLPLQRAKFLDFRWKIHRSPLFLARVIAISCLTKPACWRVKLSADANFCQHQSWIPLKLKVQRWWGTSIRRKEEVRSLFKGSLVCPLDHRTIFNPPKLGEALFLLYHLVPPPKRGMIIQSDVCMRDKESCLKPG